MGFWNKLGKIALQAAPYVAAPFTGGASLMATGATQKLGQKWAEHDAKNAIAKGLAPSKFDKILGGISMGAGLASSMGMGGAITGLTKAGAAANAANKAANVAGKASALTGWQNNLSKIGQGASILAGNAPMGAGTNLVSGAGGGGGGWQNQLGNIAGVASLAGGLFGGGGDGGGKNTAVTSDTSSGIGPSSQAQQRYVPSVGRSLASGRQDALRNQPFRAGYEVRSQGPDDANGVPSVITTKNPPIYPQYEAPQVVSPPIDESAPATPIANALAEPRARRRTPFKQSEEESQ